MYAWGSLQIWSVREPRPFNDTPKMDGLKYLEFCLFPY